jgi:hypothetical protein
LILARCVLRTCHGVRVLRLSRTIALTEQAPAPIRHSISIGTKLPFRSPLYRDLAEFVVFHQLPTVILHGVVKERLSKVAVANEEVVLLVTASPI